MKTDNDRGTGLGREWYLPSEESIVDILDFKNSRFFNVLCSGGLAALLESTSTSSEENISFAALPGSNLPFRSKIFADWMSFNDGSVD